MVKSRREKRKGQLDRMSHVEFASDTKDVKLTKRSLAARQTDGRHTSCGSVTLLPVLSSFAE